jgi:hypothetical protein
MSTVEAVGVRIAALTGAGAFTGNSRASIEISPASAHALAYIRQVCQGYSADTFSIHCEIYQ